MSIRHLGRPASAISLAAVMAISSTGLPHAVGAQEDRSVALPDPRSRADDLALTPDDSLRPAPAAFDVEAAGVAALAQVDRFVAPDWDIDELAESLGGDPLEAFAFVRDHIGFDPYPGVLRGAHGALVARAGNAWDRALLLEALVEAQGGDARLATGELDPAAAVEVVTRSVAGPLQPLADPDAEEILGLDLSELLTRARRDHALIADGLGGELASLGGTADTHLADAVTSHAWIQVDMADGSWLDLDPTLADAEPGDTLAAVATAIDEPPPELRGALRVEVIAETLADGVLSESTVLDERLDAAQAADSETWLTFQAEAAGIGGAILDAMSDVSWLPVLSVDGEDTSGDSFAVGSSGDAGDFFFGGGEPELTSLRIVLTSEAPGREPLTAERVLLDRVPPADRASGSVLPERLDPLPAAGEVLPALSGIHQVISSNGASDLRAHASAKAIALGWGAMLQQQPEQADGLKLYDLLFPLAVANQTAVLASERLLTGDIGVPGEARAFVGRPRGYLVSLVRVPEIPDGTGIITDLALDGVDVVTADGADPGLAARVRLWQGVLQGALETELSLARTAAVSPDTARASSVSLDMRGVPSLMRPDDIDTAPMDASALREVLAEGWLALVVDGSAEGSFWAVDPATGRTRSISEPGLRPGFVGGGNYVNSAGAGPTYVVDPKTGNSLGTINGNGKFTPARRPPPSRCSGGTEYVIVLGCVSIPASMTVGMVTGVVITAMVSWAIVILQLLFL